MTYRNRKLLNLAHDCPCLAQFAHACTEYQGVEPAHSDQQIFGRGHGHKSHDFAIAAMCHEHMRWIYDHTHPDYNIERAKHLRDARSRAISTAPEWMVRLAQFNDAMRAPPAPEER
jgi:hypothetical protein